MLERLVEERLVRKLKAHGFDVYKLRTPGRSGVVDRLILWPRYCPRPPTFVEIKRPGEVPRPLQLAVANDWLERGADVRDHCSTPEEIDKLCDELIAVARSA